jgi:hypothetical protein
VVARIGDKQREIAEQAQKAVQARQFRALGLSATGDELTPTVANLRKQLEALSKSVIGEDVPRKLLNRLVGVRKLLSGEFGKLTDETREAIRDLFNTIRGEFDKETRKGPLTTGRKLDLAKVTEGLGLSGDALKELQSRLSRVSPSGNIAQRGTAAFGQIVSTRGTLPPVHVHLTLDGHEVTSVVLKNLQRRGGQASSRGAFSGVRRGGI